MCEGIGHRPLRGRCPKGGHYEKMTKDKMHLKEGNKKMKKMDRKSIKQEKKSSLEFKVD